MKGNFYSIAYRPEVFSIQYSHHNALLLSVSIRQRERVLTCNETDHCSSKGRKSVTIISKLNDHLILSSPLQLTLHTFNYLLLTNGNAA